MYKPWEDKYVWVRYVLISVFVTILKSSGIAFAMTSGIILTIYILKHDKSYLYKCRYWIGVAMPLGFWGSWQLMISHYQLNNTVSYSPLSIFDASYVNPFIDFIKNKTVLVSFFKVFQGMCTSIGVILLFSLLFGILYLQIRNTRPREIVQGFSFLIKNAYIQMVVYIIGLYGLCVGSWKGQLLSCERYISTIFEMMICILVFVFLNEGKKSLGVKTNIISVTGVLVSIMAVTILAPLKSPGLYRGSIYPMYMYEDYDSIVAFLNGTAIGDKNVRTIMLFVDEDPIYSEEQQWIKGWYGHLRNMLAFSMIENNLKCELRTRFTSGVDIENLDKGKFRLILADEKWNKADYILWLHGHYTETPINSWELYHVDSLDNNEAVISQVFAGSKDK
jgi:hypothetical protein